jgi:hypothetical protein
MEFPVYFVGFLYYLEHLFCLDTDGVYKSFILLEYELLAGSVTMVDLVHILLDRFRSDGEGITNYP